MARAIDTIRQKYAAKRRHLYVPEWGLDLYSTPLTHADVAGVTEGPSQTNYDRNILVLVMKCKDAEGQPHFTSGDIHYLKHEAEFAIVQRVVEWLFQPDIASVEEARAAIDADPPSPGA